jgi:hypothetical protein
MLRYVLLIAAAMSFALGGCGNGSDEGGDHGHDEGGHGGASNVVVPDHYAHAVEKLEELATKMDGLIAEGHLDDVHPVAADIQKIAEKLPHLAKKDLPIGMLKAVNVASTALGAKFSEIDEAADGGKKAETKAVAESMKALISELKAHAGDAEKDDHDDDAEH